MAWSPFFCRSRLFFHRARLPRRADPPPPSGAGRLSRQELSSQAQKPDLANQKVALEQFCIARGIAVDEWILEIGGGMNFRRQKFIALVDDLVAGRIDTLVIAHKDRLARFSFDLLAHLAKTHGCQIVVLNTESLSPEQELVHDLMAITHCFSARLSGLRNYRKAVKKALADDKGAQD